MKYWALSGLLSVWGAATLVFCLLRLTPGDPVDRILGESAQLADREALRHVLGLDRTFFEQYITMVTGFLQGDWGMSLFQHQPVLTLIMERLPATLELAAVALAFSVSVALVMAVLAVSYRGVIDKTIAGGGMLMLCIPSFLLGPLLVFVFSFTLQLTPVGGREHSCSVILPAATLGLSLAAVLLRLLRDTLNEAMQQDFARTVYAKGRTRAGVLVHHALRVVMVPVLTVILLQAGLLMTGAVITEAVFAWPGVGGLLVESLHARDYPLIQGCIIFIALVYVGLMTLADILYALLDPRVKRLVAK